MAGETQTRQRRKEKRKQKREEPAVEAVPAKVTGNGKKIADAGDQKKKIVETGDQKKKIVQVKVSPDDEKLGGGWCSKLQLFVLITIVAGLAAVTVIGFQEGTDLDVSLSMSKVSKYLQGWIGETEEKAQIEETNFLPESESNEEMNWNASNDESYSDPEDNFERAQIYEELIAEAQINEEVSNTEPNSQEIEDSLLTVQEASDQGEVIAEEIAYEEFVPSLSEDTAASAETIPEVLKGSDLKNQVDELFDVFNDIAVMLGTNNASEKIDSKETQNSNSDISLEKEEEKEDFDSDFEDDLSVEKMSEPLQAAPEYQNDEYIEDEAASDFSAQVPQEDEAELQQEDEAKTQEEECQQATDNLDNYPEIKILYDHAKRLDTAADKEKSNEKLSEAVAAYQDLIFNRGDKLNDTIFKEVAERSIDRMRFIGKLKGAVAVHKQLIERFDDEANYRVQLAITYLLGNHLSVAKLVLHDILMRWRYNGLALVHYGFVLKNLNQDYENAVVYLQEGIDTQEPGTQDGRFFFNLGDALQRLGKNDEAQKVYKKGADIGLFLSEHQRSLYNVDRLKSRPFWTKVQTTYKDDLMEIQKYWQLIRDEGLKLLAQNGMFSNEAESLKETGDWKQLELYARGMKSKDCSLAPITCKVIEKFTPAAKCKRGQVKFSVLHPNTHVHPHCGPTNCRIRCHLGLKVPENTFIRVGNSTKSWAEGEWLVFDDSFEHEVWHNGTGTRLVLIVDVWHPDLTEDERDSLGAI